MRFGVLGPLAAWAGDGTPVRVPETKVRALLAALLAGGGPVSADRLIDDLWGDQPPGNPSNSLQTKVSQLRRALGAAEEDGRALVVFRPAGYALLAESIDAVQFTELLSRARTAEDPQIRAGLLADALALWRGPAYADFRDEAFARSAVIRLEEQRLTALEAQAEVRLALGDHTLVADELGPLAAEHPLRERLQAAYLRALYLSGRQSEALAGYDRIRDRLAEQLGADPGPELAALHLAMLRQDPGLAPADAPATSAARLGPNLPAPIAGLIGREDEVAAVNSLLQDSRLATVTGPGGVGKTRLALAVAAEADEAWLVELASLRGGDEAEVAEAVAEVLGVRDETGGAMVSDLVTRLADAFRGRPALLVLDNCEHLVEPVAELAARLLHTAPGLRILATSQEPLAIPGENVHDLAPLGTLAAAELFAARAGIALDSSNQEEVQSICSRLDGLPLALELAAARVRTLGIGGVASQLDDRFALLSAASRGVPERQGTLRSMIDWSWEQLDSAQQDALCRLSVHPGGCTAEASGVDVEVLGRLVNRSMAVAEPQSTGHMRYRLLESVAAYCLERLPDAAELLDGRDAHYAGLTEQIDLHGPTQRQWLQRLDQEWPNLRAVLDRTADPAVSVRLAWYWFLRGRHSEGLRRLSAVRDDPDAAALAHGFALLTGRRPDDDPIDAAGPRSRWFVALSHLHLGDVATARVLLDGAMARFADTGDRWGEAAVLASRAKQALYQGDLELAERSGTRSLDQFTALGDEWGRLQAADMLGYLAEITGDYERAARLHRDGLRWAENLRLWTDVSYRLSSLGRIAMLTGNLPRAEEFHLRGERLAVEQSNPFAVQFARVGRALIARRDGDLDAAEGHLERSLAWQRQLEAESGMISYGITLLLAELGFVAERRGDAARARTLHQEGLLAARAIGDPRAIALAHEGLAGAAALDGAYAEAEAMLREAEAIRESAGAPLPQAERHDVDRIRARLAASGSGQSETDGARASSSSHSD